MRLQIRMIKAVVCCSQTQLRTYVQYILHTAATVGRICADIYIYSASYIYIYIYIYIYTTASGDTD